MFLEFSELHSTTEKTEGKKAGEDAPPTNLGWDSHQAVVGSTQGLTVRESRH
jgi:hypothetical protein